MEVTGDVGHVKTRRSSSEADSLMFVVASSSVMYSCTLILPVLYTTLHYIEHNITHFTSWGEGMMCVCVCVTVVLLQAMLCKNIKELQFSSTSVFLFEYLQHLTSTLSPSHSPSCFFFSSHIC